MTEVEEIERLAELIGAADSVMVLTGAGISVPSGIPDFRTPETGMWAGVDPMTVAHVDVLHNDPLTFWQFYAQRFISLHDKQPNGAHFALVELQRRGLVTAVATQNIDLLHTKAGTEGLIELHGSIAECSCMVCGQSFPLDEVLEILKETELPTCTCGGVLKPGVVLFGDMLPERAISEATQLAMQADLMLCIGSSLEVYPVAGLPQTTLQSGGKLAVLTKGATPYDSHAAIKIEKDLEQLMADLLRTLQA